MAGLKLSMVVFMVIMVASMQLQSSTAQTRHVVGGSIGWTIPNGGAAAYTTWASGQNFRVGDSLVFNFPTGVHNVAEVPQPAYGPCNATNPISIATTGPATVALTTPGPHYYFCTVGTHCQAGQKLTINVSAAAAAPSPVPVPGPAPVSPPTAPPTAAPTTPPASSPAPSPVEASPPSPPAPAPSPAGSTTPSPAGSTTPSPAGDTTPSPAGSTTPPPPGSAAASFTAVAPATLMAIALALFY